MSNSQGEVAGAHTGLVLLAFFSDLPVSSWAFLFSASLLACEKKGGTQERMGESKEGSLPLLQLPITSRASRKGNKQITKDPRLVPQGERKEPHYCPYSSFYGSQISSLQNLGWLFPELL